MLWEFTHKNKYGAKRSRILYRPDGKSFGINPKGFGSFINVRVFKYVYEHPVIPPSLFTDQKGQKYIVPSWQKVVPETTLNDIKWKKASKPLPKPEKKEWKFESKSDPGHFYTVTQVSDFKVKCTCSGQYRAKDRKCRHMKEVMKEIGILH
jgi:hypothetical protein